MPRVSHLQRRILPLSVIALLTLAMGAACGGGSSPAATPPIEYVTPAGSVVAGATAPSPASSPQAGGQASPAASPTLAATPTAAISATAATAPSAAATPGPQTTIKIVAKDTKFSTGTITVPAAKTITIEMTNADDLTHNIAFYIAKDASQAIYNGDLIKGPNVTRVETFQSPAQPGTYYFQCDVHPAQMFGTFIVQ